MAVYSLEDVSKHNEKGSCWLVIHEGVYDVTKFMEEVSESRNAKETTPKWKLIDVDATASLW